MGQDPDELAAALKTNEEARTFFERLAYSHRRRYAKRVGEAKRQETRDRRAREAVNKLSRAEKLR